MARLFAYGTLMCPDIFAKVAGTAIVSSVPASVRNHRSLALRGEAYPGMVRSPGGEVAGLVYTFPSYLWTRLDAFEGGQYMKKPVTVWYDNGRRELVQAYLFRPECRHLLSRTVWDFDTFMRDAKQAFMTKHFPLRDPA